jgi:hypothetical protein
LICLHGLTGVHSGKTDSTQVFAVSVLRQLPFARNFISRWEICHVFAEDEQQAIEIARCHFCFSTEFAVTKV